MQASLKVKLFTYIALVLIAAITLIPFLYITLSSFKSPRDIFRGARWIPQPFTLQAWKEAITSLNIYRNLLNSFIVACGGMIIALVILIPGGYVFGRKEFPGKEILFYIITATLLFPMILLIVPLAEIMVDLKIFDSYLALWLAFQTLIVPFGMWMMRGYFAELPPDLEECAMVYGCTKFQAFYRIILPISKPAIVAVAFISFLIGWNDFLFSNMLTISEEIKPATVALYTYTIGGEMIHWGPLMAMTLMLGIPPMILYLSAQKFIATGITGK